MTKKEKKHIQREVCEQAASRKKKKKKKRKRKKEKGKDQQQQHRFGHQPKSERPCFGQARDLVAHRALPVSNSFLSLPTNFKDKVFSVSANYFSRPTQPFSKTKSFLSLSLPNRFFVCLARV